ncbi:hypothetical protein SLS55_007665 [Diplodia seriata]|uniref:Xylanolytic transcriptional activator regulatory domain-containing protein n=1 Tax=Diplodia seriata TaxID=420778 RepID=A0ABR3C8A8_9PEZI
MADKCRSVTFATRERQEEVKRLTDRVAFLEDLVRTKEMPRPVSTAHSAGSLDHHTSSLQDEKQDSSPGAGKLSLPEQSELRKRSRSLGSKDETLSKRRKLAEQGLSPLENIRPMSTPQSPSTIEAQSYIQHELEAAKDLSSTRRTVLRSVGELINQLDGKLKASTSARADFSCTGTGLQDIQYPSIEFLCWMLKEIKGDRLGFHVSSYFKHINPKNLENMGIALVNQQEDQDTLLLYSICVNAMAVKFLNTIIPEETSPEIVEEMRKSVQKYMTSAKIAMSRIPLLASPSLTLLQALLCSAFIVQGQGDTAACWAFTSAACKTCMDLGLHTGRGDFYDPRSDTNELYYCFVWCYNLDKSFSMNLGRRTSLLYTDLIKPTESIWNEAPVNLMTIYLELSRIQSVVVSDLTHKSKDEDTSEHSHKSALISKMLEQMQDVKNEMDKLKDEPEKFRGLFMESEINALEFSYWCIMTAIRRCERATTGSKTSVGENCLEAARSAICSLRSLQKPQPVPVSEGGIGLGTTMSFVNWTLLFYPLTPFFILFCNVVATSNRDDFALMKAMTEDLSDFSDRSTSIERLQRLFTIFLGLAEPLLDEDADVDADGEDDDNGNTTTTGKETDNNDTNSSRGATRRGRTRRHRRKHSSYGQALDMYFKLKGSSSSTSSSTALPPAVAASTRHTNHHPTSDPAPWDDAGPYTNTFHLSDIVPAPPTTTTTTTSASEPPPAIAPAPSHTTPLSSSVPTANMYMASPAPSHASAAAAAGAAPSYAMNYSLPPPEATEGYDIPFWELFDVQPSLDWLDVDLGPGV